MKELKFRAWNKTKNEMIKVKELSIVNNEWKVNNDNWDWYRDEYEIMQYIGLNDRVNNKEIYDRDIVKALNRSYDNEDGCRDYFATFEVTYLNGCWMFGNWNAHEFFNRFIYIEVIGNKFE